MSKLTDRTYSIVSNKEKGGGADSGGQSGDTQGLSDLAEAGGESVVELLEEGQSFEAEVTSGVEDAPEPDVAEVHTLEDQASPERPGKSHPRPQVSHL
jgi:hypothetical protein